MKEEGKAAALLLFLLRIVKKGCSSHGHCCSLNDFKGVEPAFFEKRLFLTGATDKRTLDFQIFFSGIDRSILDLETSPSKFVLLNKFLSFRAQKQLISSKFPIFANFQPRIYRVT